MRHRSHDEFGTSRPSTMGTFFKSIAAITVTGIVCGSGLAVVGINKLDGRLSEFTRFTENTIENLPQIMQNLPPVFADAVTDKRAPEYTENLTIDTRMLKPRYRGCGRAEIEVVNNGKEVVSMLALRVVSLNSAGETISDHNVYAATPLALGDDDCMRGPLLPGNHRRFAVNCASDTGTVEIEIVDVRVWDETRSQANADAYTMNNR